MAGRQGVKFEEVAKVCDELSAQGITPTQRNVRGELGTGSAATISRHINDWLEANKTERTQFHDVPTSVINAIASATKDAVEAETSGLESRIREFKQQLDDTIDALERQESDYDKLANDFASNKATSEGRELELQKQLSAKQTQCDELANQLAKINEKFDLAVKGQEAARTELAKSQMQVERADKATATAEERNKELVAELAETKQKLAKAEADANTSRAVAEEHKRAIERLDKDKAEDETLIDSLRKKVDTLQERYEDASQYKAVSVEQGKSIARLEKELTTANKKIDSLNEKFESANRAEAKALAKLEMLQGEKKSK